MTLLPMALMFVGLTLTSLFNITEKAATFGVVLAHFGVCFHLARWRLRQTGRHAVPDPLTVYLIYEVVIRGIDLLAVGLLVILPDSPLTLTLTTVITPVRWENVWTGQALFLCSTLIIVGVWHTIFGRKVYSIEPQGRVGEFAFLFMVAGVLFVGLRQLNVNVGFLTTMLKGICLGSIYIVASGRSKYAVGGSRFVLTVLATIPFVAAALTTGMKSEVLLVLLPLLVPYLRLANRRKAMVAVAALLVISTTLVRFTMEWRYANWASAGGFENIGVAEVWERVEAGVSEEGAGEAFVVSSGALVSRLSTLAPAGLVIQFAHERGFIGDALLKNAFVILIPRVLWPDKPSYSPGAWFSWYLGMAESPEMATTAVATHLPSELFLMYGLAGTLVGVTCIALVIGFSFVLLLRCLNQTPIAAAALWPFALTVGSVSGMHSVYALSAPFIFAFYAVVFFFFYKWIAPVRQLPGTAAWSS